jgi:hypothetical protein
LRSSMEHAYWVMGGLGEHDHPIGNRLTLLEAVPGRTASGRTASGRTASGRTAIEGLVRRVSETSCVGSFESQISAQRFLTMQEPPAVHDFVFESLGQLSAVEFYSDRTGIGGAPKAIEPPQSEK